MSSSLAPIAKLGQLTPGRTRRPARILTPAAAAGSAPETGNVVPAAGIEADFQALEPVVPVADKVKTSAQEPERQPEHPEQEPTVELAKAGTATELLAQVSAPAIAEEAVDSRSALEVEPLTEHPTKPADANPASDPLAAPAAPANQRKAPRKPTVTPAGVLHETIKVPLPCRIKDMSATGACLLFPQTARAVFPDPETLPNELTLVLRADRLEVDCTVVRRRGEELGVRFTSVHRPLRKIVEAEPIAGSRRAR